MSMTLSEYCDRLGLDIASLGDGGPDVKWYYAALQGAGAWLASLLFLLPVATVVSQSEVMLGIGGAGLILAAAFVREEGGIFLSQLMLACGMLGYAMVNYSAAMLLEPELTELCLLVTGTGVVSYLLVPRSFFRLALTVGVSCAWIFWCEDRGLGPEWPLAFGSVAILAAFLTRYFWSMLRPLGYGLIITVPASIFFLRPGNGLVEASVICGLAGAGLFVWTGRRFGWSLRSVALGVAGMAALAAAAPGAAMGGWVAILGRGQGNRLLKWLGLLWIPVFVSAFYYWLGYDLLTKSCLLFGCGLVLLGLRFLLKRGGSHA